MEARGRRRSRPVLRVALVLVATVAGTALVGFGGLAAWQAYTENAGNSVTRREPGPHQRRWGPRPAPRSTSTSLLNQSGQHLRRDHQREWGLTPLRRQPLATGAVKITTTGALSSTFTMQMPDAATGNLCADLLLTVVDLGQQRDRLRRHRPDHPDGAATSLQGQRRRQPPGRATSPGPAPAATPTPSPSPRAPNFNTDYADAGQSCIFAILFTQQAT